MGFFKRLRDSSVVEAKNVEQAAKEFFGYRTIYDLPQFANGFDMAGGYPPAFFMLMVSGERGAKQAMEMVEKLKPQSELLVTLIRSQPEIPSSSPVHKYSEQVVQDVLSLFTVEAREILSSHHSDLLESARWGILLADVDKERIGERPPVASGVTYEAQKLIINFTEELNDAGQILVRDARKACLQHGFFITRAGFRLE